MDYCAFCCAGTGGGGSAGRADCHAHRWQGHLSKYYRDRGG